ncbi:hypothetical protein CJZ71_17345 [Bacillus subtilis]|uniref:hypothetical protein n=1 Tax=Bacillus subtilis TaxID=1423 RepID=UPI000853E585|nr:hypothetical protein [Bacillus subtilis]AOS70209.1 hypothetical protein A4A60_05170 [Bacillus subtilis]ASV00674.1 hypothetical protein CJZ70_15460 [Bacillus subtilis]ASV04765.1 hypothetical protein CJZ71_17345 [Bacillus subtilis]AYK68187.1 hypothetical protein D9C11_16275 [Bacillus subtilis subsp. subtilis]AYK72327.1 hypothetical protein D9C09_08770 [Bacillus subtilis subsp. subtilis]
MLSACGHSKQMEIKAADISDFEKNRMDVAASQAFTAEAVNIGEGISSADMYIEHYQKGKLVERFGPVRADYSEEKPDTIQFVYFENEEGEGKNKHTTIHFGIVDKQGNIAADSSVKRDDSTTQEMTQNISSPEPITFEKPALIGSSIRGTDETMHTSEHKKELIKHQDALLYYVELHH